MPDAELPQLDTPPKITDKSKLPHNVAVARYWLGIMREQLKGATDVHDQHHGARSSP